MKTRKCGAKDPAKCRYHGKALNIPVLSDIPESKLPRVNEPLQLWEEALTPQPVFVKPSWAKDESHKHMEPVAEISTEDGRFIVMWESQSQDKRDLPLYEKRGIRVSRIGLHDYETGERVGRITATFIDEESLERSFGNDEFSVLRFSKEHRGEMIPQSLKGNRTPSEEEKNQIRHDIVKQYRAYNYWNIPKGSKKLEDMTQSEIDAESNRILSNQAQIDDYKKMVRNFHHPFVDYSSVEKETLMRKGYGTFMYLHMARMLGKEGKVLRGSGLQSPDAEGVWRRLVKTYPSLVKSTVVHEGDDPKFVLDIRK